MVRAGLGASFFIEHRDRAEFAEVEPPLVDYLRARSLDPLEMDDVMAALPALNNSGDAESIKAATDEAISRATNLLLDAEIDGRIVPRPEAIAILRDLEFLIASCIKHGLEDSLDPFEKLERDNILEALAAITQTVPRGTVFTYATANPSDHRQRSYTGDPQEATFIEAARLGCQSLDSAVLVLAGVELRAESTLTDLARLEAVKDSLMSTVKSIQDTRVGVSPSWFSQNLRPYFDPLNVNGVNYLAPGGAQMPLLALDQMLWAHNQGDAEYDVYSNENMPYCDIAYRHVLEAVLDRANFPLLQTVLAAETNTEEEEELLTSLIQIFVILQTFRSVHKGIARRSFGYRPEDAVGSGGLTPDILDFLTARTKAGRRDLVLRSLGRAGNLGLYRKQALGGDQE